MFRGLQRGFRTTSKTFKQITIYKIRDVKPKKTIQEENPVQDIYTRNVQGRKVIFNLHKLKTLSGGEKIDLLRDYLKSKQTKEALFVYNTIIENGFSNRLKYHDHHCLFHLCIQDAVQFKQGILQIHNQLKQNQYEPTENYLNEYLIVCTKWENIEASLEALEEIKKADCPVTISAWNHLISLFGKQTSVEMWERGIGLYQEMKSIVPVTRPSHKTYQLVMELYSKLNNYELLKETYYDAEDNLNRLLLDHEARAHCTEEQGYLWKMNLHCLYMCIVLDHTIEHEQFEEAHDLYSEFYPLMTTVSGQKLKSGLNVYHLLLKMLQKKKQEDAQDLLGLYWEQMNELGLEADYLLYSRRLGILNTLEDIEETYRLAITSLSLKPGTLKRQTIDSSFIQAMVKCGNTEKAIAVLDLIRHEETRKPLKIVYYGLIDKLIEQKEKGKCFTVIDYLRTDFGNDDNAQSVKYFSNEWVESQFQ